MVKEPIEVSTCTCGASIVLQVLVWALAEQHVAHQPHCYSRRRAACQRVSTTNGTFTITLSELSFLQLEQSPGRTYFRWCVPAQVTAVCSSGTVQQALTHLQTMSGCKVSNERLGFCILHWT